jgi:hypothetical protein
MEWWVGKDAGFLECWMGGYVLIKKMITGYTNKLIEK